MDGNYAEKGLTLGNYDIANGEATSTGYSRSGQEAANDPTLIGGFQINGKLKAGESANVIVPLYFKGTGNEEGLPYSNIGIFYSTSFDVKAANTVTNLNNQKDKHYFITDAGKSDNTHFRSVDQSVLDSLARDGLSPLYEDGDIEFNNTNWYSNNNESSKDDPIYVGARIITEGAKNRLQKILTKYGYEIVDFGQLTGMGSGYVLKGSYKYYDAQGNEIKLGTGNLSNFMISVKQIISTKNNQAPVINYQDQGYQTKLDQMFIDPEKLTINLMLTIAKLM